MKNYLHNDFDMTAFADVFDELPYWSAPFGIKLLDHVNYRKGITVLDIGFGSGFPLTELALRLGEDAKVYGIDPWKEATARARKKVEYYRLHNVTLMDGNAEAIPLEDQSVDLITSNNCVNNVDNVNQVLAECARVLRHDGQFLQTMNTERSMHEFYAIFEQVLREKNMDAEIEAMQAHILKKRPHVDSIIAVMRANGLEVTGLYSDTFSYRFATGSAMLQHYFIRIAFMDAWIQLIPKNRLEEVFDRIETLLNQEAEAHNGFTLSIPFVVIDSKRFIKK